MIRLLLFFVFTALAVGVALSAARRIRRVHRRYSDPAFVARLLADDPQPEGGRREPEQRGGGASD